jgi:hypothetical protein
MMMMVVGCGKQKTNFYGNFFRVQAKDKHTKRHQRRSERKWHDETNFLIVFELFDGSRRDGNEASSTCIDGMRAKE